MTPLSAADPTFLQQFGPVLAACLALMGVAASLTVTARREARRFQLEREDAYRQEQRVALSAVMVAAQTYRRTAGTLGRPQAWINSGYERATSLADQADAAMADLLNQLTVARLLIASPDLQNALDTLFGQWSKTSQLVSEIVSAFWAQESERMREMAESLEGAWPDFGAAAATLQSVALDELRPSVAA
jgi:hypothetical protein